MISDYDHMLNTMPRCCTGSLDLMRQKTEFDLYMHVQTEVDFFLEEDDSDIKSDRDLFTCKRWLHRWEHKILP